MGALLYFDLRYLRVQYFFLICLLLIVLLTSQVLENASSDSQEIQILFECVIADEFVRS